MSPHPFRIRTNSGAASNVPLLVSKPSCLPPHGRSTMPAHRDLQSTNRNVSSRCSSMHPVRPGGTGTTDSSSPSLACSRASGERAGDGATLSTCGWEEPLGMTRTTLATRRCRHRRTSPGECRSIRPSGVPLTYPRMRPAARTPRALSPTLFSFGPKGELEAPVVIWLP